MLLNTPALYVPQSFCVHEAQSALMLGHRRQGKAVNNFKPIPHSCPTLQAGQRAINDMSIEERLTRNIPKNVSKVG